MQWFNPRPLAPTNSPRGGGTHASALAALHCRGRSDPAVLEAAENALAAAVLQWPPHRVDGFREYAEHVIRTRIRRCDPVISRPGPAAGSNDQT